MKKAITLLMFILGGLYLILGIVLLISPLMWNSMQGIETLRDIIRNLIGKGTAIDDDTTIALSLLLLFQGIKLLEHRERTAGSLLYSIWLLVPALLAIAAVDSAPGIIPSAISSAIPGTALTTLLFSIFLTIIFRLLISMTKNVKNSTDYEGMEAKKALPAPREKEAQRPEPAELEIVHEPAIYPEEEKKEEIKEEKKDQPLSEETLQAIDKAIKNTKGTESFTSLIRKRKKLMQLPTEELLEAINNIKGFRVYTDSKGQIGNIEDELGGMIQYSFSPFTIIALNKKGTIKRIACPDMTVPAFSIDQAIEIAEKCVKEYSKGGYSYSAMEGELKVSSKSTKIERDSFIVPWYRQQLSYSDPVIGERLFAVDFHLRYSRERGLQPYKA